MYSVRGKFSNGHTFRLSPVTAEDAKGALQYVLNLDAVKTYSSPVEMVTVKKLTGRSSVRISDEPAKPRERKDGKKPATPAAKTSTPSRR